MTQAPGVVREGRKERQMTTHLSRIIGGRPPLTPGATLAENARVSGTKLQPLRRMAGAAVKALDQWSSNSFKYR